MAEYDPSQIEPRWQRFWEEKGTFKLTSITKKKFYCLDMFPYPSGAGLHIGHPLGYTATDIYSRYKRMNGFSVLHPMGFDAFGLPAEQHAINTGEHPGVVTEQNCKTFVTQMKRIGLSYDWDRELATCTPDYYHWTQWIFLKLYNSWFDESLARARPIEELVIPDAVKQAGQKSVEEYRANFRLAFNGEAMVNWCPALGTVLANEEVIEGKSERGGHDVVRKPMKQWMLRITAYTERLISELDSLDWPEAIKEQQRNWIGKKRGAEIEFRVQDSKLSFSAFTTRPDTLFGVTFFVISPEHQLTDLVTTPEMAPKVTAYRDEARKMSELVRTIENRKKTGVFTGSYVINPVTQAPVPLYVGDYVLMSFGTGAVMGVPAHDERDFEFARTFQLEIVPVIKPDAATPEVTQAVIDGEIAWTERGSMLPCEASVAKQLRLAGIGNLEAAERICGWLEEKKLGKATVTYKLRDWIFSRQRYWGEPIPIIHWDDGISTALEESELPLRLPQVADYKPSDGGESPLAKATEWLKVRDSKTGRTGRRETNTMPQWAGSCWYYLRFIDPKNERVGWDPALESTMMPVDLYVGGTEHAVLHLLYARFWHKVLFDLGYVSTREPFQKLYNQGMIQAFAYKDRRGALVAVDQVDAHGDSFVRRTDGEKVERIIAKMSKSLKNVINPDEVIADVGADTLRLYLMFMGPLDSSRVWDSKAIQGVHRFLRRSWSFVTDNRDTGARDVIAEKGESVEVRRAIHRAVKRVTHDIEQLSFNTAISSLMEFLNEVGTQAVSGATLERFILILSPLAPHIGEELWNRIGHKESLAYQAWPTFDALILTEEQVTVVVQVEGKKRGLIEVPRTISADELKNAVIAALAASEYRCSLNDRFITVHQPGGTVPKLVNVIRAS